MNTIANKTDLSQAKTLVSVNQLRTSFEINRGLFKKPYILKAVNDVSFTIKRGTTLGLVGESGCGKSTLGKSLLGLFEQASGEMLWHDDEAGKREVINAFMPRKMRKRMQMIFQDPYSSLNPRLKISEIIEEGMLIHKLHGDRHSRRKRAAYLLDQCGLPASALDKFPHEFSGGQRQRVGIARALSVDPEFIVCDEAVSALDVSIQSQILNLLQQLQHDLGITYLFISHDLSVVRHISDEVAVMYLGRIVEHGSSHDIFDKPLHPYTQALLSAAPGQEIEKRILLKGEVPSPLNPPNGCHFHPRCHLKTAACESWQYQKSNQDNREVYCNLFEKQ